MRRTEANILSEIDLIPADAAAEARYGADLLGRAVGHEIAASGLTPPVTYGEMRRDWLPIFADAIDNPTHRIMAVRATWEI